MNIFYNENGIGDVLLVQLTTTTPEVVVAKSEGDVTILHDEKTEEVVGFNLFNASSYARIEGNGEVPLTEEILDEIKNALVKNNVDLLLEVDLSPKFVVGHVLTKEQ